MNRDHFKRLINSFIPIYSCITNKSERKYHLQQVSSEMSSFEKRLQGFLGCSKNWFLHGGFCSFKIMRSEQSIISESGPMILISSFLFS